MMAPGRAARFLRTRIAPHALAAVAGLPAVRPALLRTISQVRAGCRDSALSDGRTGRPAAEDQLPWVPAAGGDNIAPLAWQIRIHGAAGEDLAAAADNSGHCPPRVHLR